MRKIRVAISETMPMNASSSPSLSLFIRAENKYFNSKEFTAYRKLLALHEAGHILFHRRFEHKVKMWGPTIYFYEPNIFITSNASISVVGSEVYPDVTSALKTSIAGFVFRKQLSNTPNEKRAVDGDMRHARKWFDTLVGGDDVAFGKAIETARAEIIEELKNPVFVDEVWATAREFELVIFGCLS